MERHEATFEIDSKSDSDAVRRILTQLFDTVREESRNVREGSNDASELLSEFEKLRDAADEPAPGTLEITYERHAEDFSD